MKVLKFGGSSLADAIRFQTVAGIAARDAETTPLILVLSAPQGVTDALLALVSSAGTGCGYRACHRRRCRWCCWNLNWPDALSAELVPGCAWLHDICRLTTPKPPRQFMRVRESVRKET